MTEYFVPLFNVYNVIKSKQISHITGISEIALMEGFVRTCLNHFRYQTPSDKIANEFLSMVNSTGTNLLFNQILVLQLTPLISDFRETMSGYFQNATNFNFHFRPKQTTPNGFFIRVYP